MRLYLINNHFSSGPNSRITQRRAQAAFAAALAASLLANEPNARVVVGGDLNVYPRPDDPFSPRERKTPSDQLAPLYDEAKLWNLWDVVAKEAPSAAYSYVYQGQAQTLDHLFVSRALRASLRQARYVHVNADFAGEEGEATGGAIPTNAPVRGASDHDPLLAIFSFADGVAGVKLDAERPGAIVWAMGEAKVGDAAAGNATAGVTGEGGAKVNLNTATAKQLEMLPGIGPTLAARIIAHREANGPFTSAERLDAVRGIGPATLERLRPLVTVE